MKFPCTLRNALLIIRDHFGLSFASKGLGYLAALFLLLSLLARYKSSCYQTKFPSAPRWVQHSYLSKRATIDPLYLWVVRGTGILGKPEESVPPLFWV